MTMAKFTRAQLAGYLDDALGEAETTHIEQALRQSESLRQELRALMQERDRGEHSLGAVWRRQRLSCPTRDQLGSYLLKVLEPEQQDYIHFHVHTIGCSFCQANLADLEARQKETGSQVKERRQRFFQSSAGLLRPGHKKKRN
jgi:hypothetical protein